MDSNQNLSDKAVRLCMRSYLLMFQKMRYIVECVG